MSAFLLDFAERRRQVRHYLAVVLGAERAAGIGTASRAQERRLLTLRAGTFLLVYNLVEATVRGAIQEIHERIVSEQVPFGWLSLELRKEVVRRFINDAKPDVNHTMRNFPAEFVAVALEPDFKLSGNVDARLIRELGDCYGFSCDTKNDRTWAGSDLLTVKSKRNDLAHGTQSFEEVGRDYPTTELLGLTRRSVWFMSEILTNIANYLDEKGYLEPQYRP